MSIKVYIVELDTGHQEFFMSSYDAFKYAKAEEKRRTHSVEYVVIGETEGDEFWIYNGQLLRHTLRMLDNPVQWLKAQIEFEKWID